MVYFTQRIRNLITFKKTDFVKANIITSFHDTILELYILKLDNLV